MAGPRWHLVDVAGACRWDLKDLGCVPFPDDQMSPAAHAKLFASDLVRIAKLVESSGIKQSEAK